MTPVRPERWHAGPFIRLITTGWADADMPRVGPGGGARGGVL